MNESSLAHTRWDCACRIVWIPKYRRRVLYGQARAEVGQAMRELVDKKTGCEVVRGAVCPGRARLCLRMPPKYALSEVVGYLKGKSALVLYDRHPERGRVVGKDRTLWARGYYASTVGLNEEVIKRYISDQDEGREFR